ncbi:hypothetical protein SeMB42_g06232 [Synchytrium endobioticum]|uniref:E2F/DP family winged-helix DNA-binding domain-containing protein n=1 Tax=Synchytrium endobioticum TaxID=286115 RepID=A0A507CQJ3_9FUNG|nr:hypothetical protein SeMB42_g06232 [Synchytrium endobioticum]TPX41350.1 hypothetical protein SeLEV6574_g06134 [Synchytrium endobioticum]
MNRFYLLYLAFCVPKKLGANLRDCLAYSPSTPCNFKCYGELGMNTVSAPSPPAASGSVQPTPPPAKVTKKPFVPSSVSDDDPLKNIKGLRHFSKMVADKVEAKGETTYNEVADELVVDFTHQAAQYGGRFDQKNIRRRVYDALNVLMAMDIIEKDKKFIRWIGMPTEPKPNSDGIKVEKQDLTELMERHAELQAAVEIEKREIHEKMIKESRLRQLAYQNEQIERERQLERERYSHEGSSYSLETHDQRIFLPFVLIQCPKTTNITIEEGSQKSEYMFTFSEPFTLHEDNEVIGHIGGFLSPINNVVSPAVPQLPALETSGSGSTCSPSACPSPAPTYQQVGGLVGYSLPPDYGYEQPFDATPTATDAFAASLATRLTSEKSLRQRQVTAGSELNTPMASVPASPRLSSSLGFHYYNPGSSHIPPPHHYPGTIGAPIHHHHYAMPAPQNPSKWTMMGVPYHPLASSSTSGTASGIGTPPSLSRVPSPHLFQPTYAYGAGPAGPC